MNVIHADKRDEELSILLVGKDDSKIDFIRANLKEAGFQNIEVTDVDEAVSLTDRAAADLLLVDIETVSTHELGKIKSALANAIPIIGLTLRTEVHHLAEYQDQGMNDIVALPENASLLAAKINFLIQAGQIQTEKLSECRELGRHLQRVEQEQAVAANLFHNILRNDFLETSAVKSVVSERSLLNGDIVLVGRTPENNLHILVGDFSGSGISASIAAAPVAEIFYGMSGKGFDVVEIAEEINRKLHKLLPVGLFLATSLVSLHPDAKTLHVLNCGLPDHFLVNRNSQCLKPIPSYNLPLGVQSSVELKRQSFEVGNDDYLYLLTAAVSEVKNSAGESFGSDSVINCITRSEDSAFESLQYSLQQHCINHQAYRDITFLELHCDVDKVPWKGHDRLQNSKSIKALAWKAMMEFDIQALRNLNPVPVLVNSLMEIQGIKDHQQTIFMIVTELFANALDHGVLKLDSAIKQSPEGFMRFYELKEERLKTTERGYIRILFNHQPTATGGRLTIRVKDSGDGFDRDATLARLNSNTGYSGRGIRLLETLCNQITYQGRGNRVTAVFDWEL